MSQARLADMAYKRTRYPNVYFRGDVLYYRFRDERGQRAEVRYGSAGTPKDAFAAQQVAQDRAERIRAGTLDPKLARIEEHAHRPVDELLAEYEQHLSGKSPGHVRESVRFIRKWVGGCEIKRLGDADAHRVNRWLDDQPWAARTRNYARSSILGFCRWASDYGRIAYNPVPSSLVPKANEDADRRRLSRSMSRSDFDALVTAAPLSRRVYYLLAAFTGLRWREIARLRWCDVDGNAISVPAGQTKNDQRADLWMVDRLVSALDEWRREQAPGPTDSIFATEPRLKTWKLDLIRAGVVRAYCDIKTRREVMPGYRDDRGRQIDRKCLRMTFVTWLKDAGVDLRDAQRLARHSDPKLTANIYTDSRLVDLRRAVEKLDSGEQRVKPETEQVVRLAG